MTLNKDTVQSLALAELNTYKSIDDLSIKREKALNELEEEIISEFNDLNTQKTKIARLENFKIKEAVIDDYSERVLYLDNAKCVVYGIRHMNGNKRIPFVQLLANFKILSKNHALEIYKKVETKLNVFNPLYLSYWCSEEGDADFIGSTYLTSSAMSIKELNKWNEETK